MFKPFTVSHDIAPLIRQAVERAEKQYPNRRFMAHVEIDDNLILQITIMEDDGQAPEVLH